MEKNILCNYKARSIFDTKYITTEQPSFSQTFILQDIEIRHLLPIVSSSSLQLHHVVLFKPNATVVYWWQTYRRDRWWLQQISMPKLAAGRSPIKLQLRRPKGSAVRSLHGQSISSTVSHCANHSISAHPAGAERKHLATSVQMGLESRSRACFEHVARAFSVLVGYYLGSIRVFVESSDDV